MAVIREVAAGGTAGGDLRKIGSRLEPFIDGWLIEVMRDLSLKLHPPIEREVVLTHDEPWEGNTSTYVSIFQDEGLFRMYYRGSDWDEKTDKSTHQAVCYAESGDGVNWAKPDLGLVSFKGSKKNNIIWDGVGNHNFTPFKDTNPDCRSEARYKVLGGSKKTGLMAFQSSDAIHWSLMQDTPVITEGAFDSQNLAFWDSVRERYVDFHRDFHDGVRDIMTCTSEDFIRWTEPGWIDYGEAPAEHLYTNAVTPHPGAPHIFIGFPKRFVPTRKVDFHPKKGVSDGVFMSSRDGVHWKRHGEAFIRPGPNLERWVNRNNMIAWGVLTTKAESPGMPDELSIYACEGYYSLDSDCRLRRFTVRQEGFVSVHANAAGGEFLTHPLQFEGSRLVINYSTSAAGSVLVEIADTEGKPVPGFSFADCPEIFGDEIERTVEWKKGPDLKALAGKPVRLRFRLKDGDLYSVRFSSRDKG